MVCKNAFENVVCLCCLLHIIYSLTLLTNISVEINSLDTDQTTGVIPISLFLLATGTVLRKAAIDRGVRLATGRYGCRYRGVTS